MDFTPDTNEDKSNNLLDQLEALQERMRADLPEQSASIIGLYAVSLLAAATFITGAYLVQIPQSFPTNTVVTVEKGQSVDEVAQHLQQQHVITSPAVLSMLIRTWYENEKIVAGEYYFQKPRSVFTVARRLSQGEYGLVPYAVTIPEGATSFQIAEILENKLGANNFDKETFLKYATPLEGYLFPDTYSFLPNTEEKEIVTTMQKNFQRHVETIRDEMRSSDRSLGEVVIMASLLEKEARTTRSRRIIAGILWKRLRMDMRLQVDAVFTYINGKSTFDLTYEDLRNESLYNTYRHKGLPVGPIANPGMDALTAAVNPIETDYLFYLSDMQGDMHYAENFEEHKINKRRFLSG